MRINTDRDNTSNYSFNFFPIAGTSTGAEAATALSAAAKTLTTANSGSLSCDRFASHFSQH
jgi:hypothetical protein